MLRRKIKQKIKIGNIGKGYNFQLGGSYPRGDVCEDLQELRPGAVRPPAFGWGCPPLSKGFCLPSCESLSPE